MPSDKPAGIIPDFSQISSTIFVIIQTIFRCFVNTQLIRTYENLFFKKIFNSSLAEFDIRICFGFRALVLRSKATSQSSIVFGILPAIGRNRLCDFFDFDRKCVDRDAT